MKKLLDNSLLEKSSIVANSSMNRQRKCFGGNSYQKELSFDILDFLQNRLQSNEQISWLDICCGEGNALIEAVTNFEEQKSNLQIIGIDLAGMFRSFSSEIKSFQLIETSFENFNSETEFDLITCVHGLHYIGDKLAFLQKAVSMLQANGVFLANLDLNNFKFENGKSAGQTIIKSLRKKDFDFNSKKHLLTFSGKKKIELEFEYLGADDSAGANYTGQSVVNSYYKFSK
jgi:ubiquinone/menaquinone biosynthesis C-methylase UbiE